jgi:hypothetical protein
MSKIPYDPETGRSYRRLQMCFACIHGFHLSCSSAECTCRGLNHNAAQSVSSRELCAIRDHQAQIAGAAAHSEI